MKNFELISFSNEQELANTAAADFVRQVATANSSSTPFLVALSGGRIARNFFTATAEQIGAKKVGVESVHFFWGDERCVPPSDPESNYGVARSLLLAPLNIPAAQIHRLRGEDAPDAAAVAGEEDLSSVATMGAYGQPVIDLILLGMGEDGHVASLFPGEGEAIAAASTTYRAVTAVKPPPRRLTLGYAAIAAARQVWVLASGAGKAGALRNSLAPNGSTPLARVIRQRSLTKVYTDIQIGSGGG